MQLMPDGDTQVLRVRQKFILFDQAEKAEKQDLSNYL